MGKNQDPGSGINIPDPQHCMELTNDESEKALQEGKKPMNVRLKGRDAGGGVWGGGGNVQFEPINLMAARRFSFSTFCIPVS